VRVLVVGYGTVGKAQAYLLENLGHIIHAYDPYVFQEVKTPEKNVEMVFICTPEGVVESVVGELVNFGVKGLYVIKSTVPIGETERISKKYDLHLCHNPEFLREKYALEDVMHQNRIVIGQCCDEHGKMVRQIYEPLGVPIFVTDTKTSELVKLATNVLRATLITFWNEIHELATKSGLDTRKISTLVDQVKTIGFWEGGDWGIRFFGKSFGGKCLPKDLELTISSFRANEINPILFEAIKMFNDKMRKKERNC